jgi:hypothetical protein
MVELPTSVHYRSITALLLAAAMIFLTACEAATSPTPAPPASPVDIVHPLEGTVIYAEMIYLSGTLQGEPLGFRLELIGTDDTIIAQTTLNEEPGNWQVELIHGYAGDPSEITIRAVADDDPTQTYDTVTVFIADSDHRPPGSFGTIIEPAPDSGVGGDSILVQGTASGLFENEFILVLVAPDDSVIDEQFVLLSNPYFIDEVPWQAEFTGGDYTGPAEIRAYHIDAQDGSENTLDSVNVIIGEAAG